MITLTQTELEELGELLRSYLVNPDNCNINRYPLGMIPIKQLKLTMIKLGLEMYIID